MKQQEVTSQFCNSNRSTKCTGAGNGRKQSVVTAKVRRQVNKKRRRHLERDLEIGGWL